MSAAAQVLPLKVVVELNDLRTRLAAVANPPREVFLALYDGAEPELFTTVEAARDCCDDLAKVDAGERCWDWSVNEYGVHVQFWTHVDDDRPLSETSGSVTPVVVQGAEPLSELERLRAAQRVERIWYRHKARMERRERERADRLAAEVRELRARVAELGSAAEAEKTSQWLAGYGFAREQMAEAESGAPPQVIPVVDDVPIPAVLTEPDGPSLANNSSARGASDGLRRLLHPLDKGVRS